MPPYDNPSSQQQQQKPRSSPLEIDTGDDEITSNPPDLDQNTPIPTEQPEKNHTYSPLEINMGENDSIPDPPNLDDPHCHIPSGCCGAAESLTTPTTATDAVSILFLTPLFLLGKLLSTLHEYLAVLSTIPSVVRNRNREFGQTISEIKNLEARMAKDLKIVGKDQEEIGDEIDDLRKRIKKIQERRERWKVEAEKIREEEEICPKEDSKVE